MILEYSRDVDSFFVDRFDGVFRLVKPTPGCQHANFACHLVVGERAKLVHHKFDCIVEVCSTLEVFSRLFLSVLIKTSASDACDKLGPVDYAVDAEGMIVENLVDLIGLFPDEGQFVLNAIRFSPENIVARREIWLHKMSVSI
jgi:hypothetical protein